VPRDDSAFTAGFAALKGLELRFDWPNPKDRGAEVVYRILDAPGMAPALVQLDREDRVVATSLADGARAPLQGLRGVYLAADAVVERGRLDQTVVPVSDEEFLAEGGGNDDDLLAAWADIEIDGPWGKVRRGLTPLDRGIFYGPPGGRPVYAFGLVKTQMARDWFSVLTVLDHEGREVKSHPVQVNSPLRYGGYRFFQATAQTGADGIGISGISVTSNPGVNFMYVGYIVLTLGVSYIFFLKPILDRRRRARRAAERERTA
jgi:hypothetical protein